MNRKPRAFRDGTARMVGLALAAGLLLIPGLASAQRTQYLGDGAAQTNAGGWDYPTSTAGIGTGTGSCPADTTLKTKPECTALRLTASATKADCEAVMGTVYGVSQRTQSWSTGACNDTETNELDCEAQPGRLFSNGICAVTLKGYDRNNVSCTLLGGTWVGSGLCTGAWVLPPAASYTPPLLNTTSSASPGTGDQCLRCHTSLTEWNGPRVRDVETFLKTGHKNMSRKVVSPYKPWAGPHGDEYPTDDSGNAFNWSAGQVTVGGTAYDLTWIYGDWLAPLPRAVYKKAPNGTSPGMSYSCGRCHTTGWTSDATLQSAKEPETSFPGVTWDGVTPAAFGQVNLAGGVSGDANKMSSWDVWGISCARCHGSSVNNTGLGVPYGKPTGMETHHNDLTGATDDQCTDPRFTDETVCTTNGGTWIAASGTAACSVAGVCSVGNVPNPAILDQPACTAAGGAWAAATDIVRCLDIHEYGKEHAIPAYTAAKFTGTATNRGQIITRLCMDCHRQEKSGKPYADAADAAGDPATAHPGQYLKVGNSHGALGFVSHAGANEFLNSPHARFSGTFNEIATAKLGTGYSSYFMAHGEAANTGNGCTGCHDVHNSMVPATGQSHKAIREECTECHSGSHNVDLTKLKHPTGAGTPLETMNSEACITCHMPGGLHLWRIKASNGYSTFPASALGATVNANTSPDGTYSNAVWVDVDMACGQCHGGGTNQATTSVSASSSATLTVASANGFVAGSRVRIAGAGALGEDGLTREDYHGTVKTVTPPNQIVLLAAPSASPVGKSLVQNPLANGAHYRTKAELSVMATGMHMDQAPAANGVIPSFTVAPAALAVNVNASASTCTGGAVNCDEYNWDFGDGGTATGASQAHTYATAGTYVITLTVVDTGVGEASTTKTVTVRGAGPVADGTCSFNANTWTMTVTNTSTAANGLKLVAVDWNQGLLSRDYTAPFDGPFTHLYAVPGTFKIYLRAIDKTGISNRKLVCTTAPAQFTLWSVTGTVRDGAGLPLGAAKVQVQRAGSTTVFRNVYTAANGTYTLANLKPGTYTLAVIKTGYTFPAAVDVTVGGNKVNDVNALP